MRCPFCNADKDYLKVIDSRTGEGDRAIRRRRRCLSCGKRFTTYERIEENIRLTVIKKDGTRVPFDRQKLLTVVMVSVAKHGIATPAELQAAFKQLPP